MKQANKKSLPGPSLDRTVQPNPVQIFDMLEGFSPVKNLLGLGDPDVHRIDNRWWMFFGGFHTGFRNNLFSASLPKGAPLSSNEWKITTAADNPKKAVPLVDQPPEGCWDHYGLHNPSYVTGIIEGDEGIPLRKERIYYTGRNCTSFVENKQPLSIGVMEKTPQGWARHPEPILQGTSENPSVLEPKVRYFEGKWRLWHVATPKVAGRKTLPVYEVRYTESDNGITDWTEPKVLFNTLEGYYDAVVSKRNHGYEMLVCRSGNLGNKTDFPQQGIWWLSSKSPSGNRQDWTEEPAQILKAGRDAEDWYGNGITDTSMQFEGDHMFVFFTGVNRETSWLRTFFKRISSLKKPPFPSPFFLSIGRAQFRRSS